MHDFLSTERGRVILAFLIDNQFVIKKLRDNSEGLNLSAAFRNYDDVCGGAVS